MFTLASGKCYSFQSWEYTQEYCPYASIGWQSNAACVTLNEHSEIGNLPLFENLDLKCTCLQTINFWLSFTNVLALRSVFLNYGYLALSTFAAK